jgi:hypothetical protein
MPIEWGANSKTRAQSAKPAPNDPPPNRRTNLGAVRALRSALLALDVRKLDGSKRGSGLVRIDPHAEISSKFEVLGPRNGRRRTSSKPLEVKAVYTRDSDCPCPHVRGAHK